MKAGKLRFRKGKEKQVGNAGWKDNSLVWGILLLPIYRVKKKGACVAMCCVRWRGAFRPVYGKRTEQSAIRLCGWPCDGSGVNGRKVPQTKGYPFSHGKAPKKNNG